MEHSTCQGLVLAEVLYVLPEFLEALVSRVGLIFLFKGLDHVGGVLRIDQDHFILGVDVLIDPEVRVALLVQT